MRAKALVVGFAAAAGGWAAAQPAPAAERAEVGQDAFDPALVPLVEVTGAREDGQAIMGVVVAPGQALLSPGEQWMPGARVHCARTGEEGAVTRVLNWGGRGEIEWAVLEIEWSDGAGPAPLVVAEEDANAGEALRVASWRNGGYTVLERWVELAFCPSCTHHLRTSTDDATIEQHRLGSPMLNEHGELVGILYGVGFQSLEFEFLEPKRLRAAPGGAPRLVHSPGAVFREPRAALGAPVVDEAGQIVALVGNFFTQTGVSFPPPRARHRATLLLATFPDPLPEAEPVTLAEFARIQAAAAMFARRSNRAARNLTRGLPAARWNSRRWRSRWILGQRAAGHCSARRT
jgi:hypothetical protein